MVEATSIRAALDADGLPYSILVYAILAALQTLHAARLLGSRGGTGGVRLRVVPKSLSQSWLHFILQFGNVTICHETR